MRTGSSSSASTPRLGDAFLVSAPVCTAGPARRRPPRGGAGRRRAAGRADGVAQAPRGVVVGEAPAQRRLGLRQLLALEVDARVGDDAVEDAARLGHAASGHASTSLLAVTKATSPRPAAPESIASAAMPTPSRTSFARPAATRAAPALMST